jgi:ribosomal protein L11 methyltransferase
MTRARKTGKAAPRVLTTVAAEVPRGQVEAVCDWLAEAGVAATSWEDWEGGASRVEMFLDSPAGAAPAVQALRDAGRAVGLALDPVVGTLKDEDWTENWKRFFHAERVSPRLVIRPPWEPWQVQGDEQVIVIDPGMSFGTGRHATTRACLQLLDRLADGDGSRRVLDIGCGSGILSIAAAKLGFTRVRGFDNDPDAVRIAAENAAFNNVAIEFFTADLASGAVATGDIVIANVLASVLGQHAARVAAAVHDGAGHALLLSGILDGQYPAIVECYSRHGFRERQSILIGEWRSGWFARG